MSRPQLLENPTVRRSGGMPEAVGGPKTCRFASNCSCVFNRVEPSVAAPDARADAALQLPASSAEAVSTGALSAGLSPAAARAQVAELVQRGWKVVSADSRTIVLQRRRNMPFCVDVLLCAVTVMLWSIHMVWRARHPKIETTTLTLAP